MKTDERKHRPEDVNSEEVRDIIERMPTHWATWVTIVTASIIAVIFTLSCFVKYPESVAGTITITMDAAPVRLLSCASGRIHLMISNSNSVTPGETLAYIENGTSYSCYKQLISLLKSAVNGKDFMPLQYNKALGELSSYYNTFIRAQKQLDQLQVSPLYDNLCQNIEQQIQANHEAITYQDHEISLKSEQWELNKQLLHEDSLLVLNNSISKEKYQDRRNTCLAYEDSYVSLQSSRATNISEIGKNKIELSRIRLQRQEDLKQALADYDKAMHELNNAINVWEKRYLIKSPISGTIEYLGFWRDNVTVDNNQELFAVIPSKNECIGEAYIPIQGAGKVKPGQMVNVTLEDFPAWEYGKIEGKVKSVSQTLINVHAEDNAVRPMYLVTVDFPNGLSTNYGSSLKTKPEIKGQINIITTPKRLIQRLFDNLKSIGK